MTKVRRKAHTRRTKKGRTKVRRHKVSVKRKRDADGFEDLEGLRRREALRAWEEEHGVGQGKVRLVSPAKAGAAGSLLIPDAGLLLGAGAAAHKKGYRLRIEKPDTQLGQRFPGRVRWTKI